MPATTVALLAVLLLAAPAAARDELIPRNLLHNGDFEVGTPELPDGWQKSWFGSDPAAPALTREREAAHAGRAGAALRPRGEHWTALQQTIDDAPKSATLAHLAAWVRLQSADARASLTISFPAPGEPGRSDPPSVYRSRELSGPCEWTLLELEAPVPEGCTSWTVGCAARTAGAPGESQASFDDVQLSASDSATELVGATLAVARGSYSIEATKGACDEPWVEFSIPLPLGGQTPLALRVISEPPGAVQSLRLMPDRENRPLRVQCKPVRPGDVIKLTAETVVLLHDRPPVALNQVRLPAAQKVPPPVKAHLLAAPGLRPDDPTVRAAADKLSRDDLASLFTDLRGFLEYKLAHSGDGQDHAIHESQHDMAVGSRWANLTASVLMACGVPTRLLACTGIDGSLQERYVLEAWTEKLGWTRLDPFGEFPWGDTRNIVLRVIYPDAPRTAENIPTFVLGADGIFGAPDMNPVTLDWQAAETLGSFALPRAELAALEGSARAAYEALAKTPATDSRVTWLSAPGKDESEPFARVRAALAERLGR
jgi:hypothetical protein